MNNYLINPFNRIAGLKSLLIGLLGLFLLSLAAYMSGTHFYGLSNIDFAKDSGLLVYTLEHLISWVIFAVLTYLLSLFLSSSKVRLIDFLGTALLARFPLIISPIIRFIPGFQSFVFQSFEIYFVVGVYLLSAIWAITLLFNGYRISSNLKNNKLIVSFIIGLVVSEILTRISIQLIILKI